MQPGEVRFAEGPITIIHGRPVTRLHVRNTSSRTVRVSSHFHFYEVNHRLIFDRESAYGLHLDLPAGGTVRFAPGEEQEVALVPYAGARVIQGFNGLAAQRRMGGVGTMPRELSRWEYSALYGPTTGDRIRLGDSSLLLRIEHDYAQYGDEPLWGYGKNMRNGMMLTSEAPSDTELDLIIVGAIVIDPVLGIFKGSIGVKEGRIVAIGNAGNPDIVDNVDLLIGPGTVAMAGGGLIATPGGGRQPCTFRRSATASGCAFWRRHHADRRRPES